MHILKPNKNENKEDFIKRCIADKDMIDKYPEEEKREAAGVNSWNDKKSLNTTIERRYTPVEELRFDSEKNELQGYAARFNVWSGDLGGFREKIRPGAFKKTIKEADVRALFNHDSNYILGRTTNDTLELSENGSGLKFKVKLPDTSYARDLKVSIDRGDVNQCSFGFTTVADEWSEDYKKRELIECKLFDVSPVVYPAYPQTEVKLRSAMIEIGIDYNVLNMSIIKSNRGIGLSDNEKEIVERSIDILNGLIKNEEPGQTHSSEAKPDFSTLLRLRMKRRECLKIL